MKGRVVLVGILLGMLLLSGCVQEKDVGEKTPSDGSGIDLSELEASQELKKFSSAGEIREFLKAQIEASQGFHVGAPRALMGEMMVGMEEMAVTESGMPVPAPTPATKAGAEAGEGEGAAEYSTTNIQVEGVDEADFVKNDGKYIYTLVQDNLVIVRAYPPEEAEILSKREIQGKPREIFVRGDRLVVFTEDTHDVLFYPEYGFKPETRRAPRTSALIYNISLRENPRLVTNYSLNGEYFQSRMINDWVYLIVKDHVYYHNDFIDLPRIREGSVKVMRPEIYYFDNPEENYVFHTIAAINIRGEDEITAKSFMMGYSNNLYVSKKNIYITYPKNLPYRYYQEERREIFHKIVTPLLPEDTRDAIEAIRAKDLGTAEEWEAISSILEEMYNQMDENEKEALIERIEDAVREYEEKKALERDKTIIHKIRIEDGDIEYEARGEVPGRLLNQFSLDEYEENLRVATTTRFWTRRGGSTEYNNVYVLDPTLTTIGSLEEIAPSERIYSTRFIGERLYMVTFKRTDPFFVIDLSEPERPEVLGKLKIPGFSDYLHPYDEDHIIGIGKETGTNEWGGVSIKGVKLALFNVSNVEEPEEIDRYEIGESGTDSEALHDHKAFLFSRKKNLLVIPIREVMNGYSERGMQKVWQGAYVFNVTLTGFKLKGRVTHENEYEEEYYHWHSPAAVRRALYIDNTLYTISSRKILMNKLVDLSKVGEITLPYKERLYYS